MRDEYSGPRAFLGTYVEPEVKRELIDLAHEHRTSLSMEIREAVEKHLHSEHATGESRLPVPA